MIIIINIETKDIIDKTGMTNMMNMMDTASTMDMANKDIIFKILGMVKMNRTGMDFVVIMNLVVMMEISKKWKQKIKNICEIIKISMNKIKSFR